MQFDGVTISGGILIDPPPVVPPVTSVGTLIFGDDFTSGSPTGWTNYGAQNGGTLAVVDGAWKGVMAAGVNDTTVYATKNISSENLSDIYIQFRAKMPASKHGIKFCKIFGQNSNGYANFTFGLDYTGLDNGGFLGVSYGDGTTTSNDTQCVIFFDSTRVSYVGRAPSPVILRPMDADFASTDWGTDWHTFKFRIKFNSGTTAVDEVADGAVYVEIDGNVYLNATGLFNRHYSNGPIDRVGIWNATQGGVPSNFELWYDDFKISTGGFVPDFSDTFESYTTISSAVDPNGPWERANLRNGGSHAFTTFGGSKRYACTWAGNEDETLLYYKIPGAVFGDVSTGKTYVKLQWDEYRDANWEFKSDKSCRLTGRTADGSVTADVLLGMNGTGGNSTSAIVFRNYGSSSNMLVVPSWNMSREQWYTIAVEVQMNTVGNADGWVKLWRNGVLMGSATGVNVRGGTNDYTFQQIGIGGWESGGAPSVPETRYIDNVKVWYSEDVVAGSATPWLEEDFSTYSSSENMLADPRSIYSAEDVNTAQIVLDTSDGYNGLTQCMRYDWPDRSGVCSDYVIGRNISFSSLLTEVWVEVVIKLSSAWTTVAAGCGGVSNPDYKFVFGRVNGISSRFDSRIGNSGNNIINGYPGNEAADIVATTRTDLLDDQWHVFRWHWKIGNGNGISRMWIDGVLESDLTSIDTGTATNIYGLALGRNINQGPDEIQTLKWGQIRVFNSNPGWIA